MAKQKLQASPQISNGDPLVRFNNLVLSDLIVSSFEYMRPVTAWFISFLNRYTIHMGPILFLTVSRRVHQNNVLNDKDYIRKAAMLALSICPRQNMLDTYIFS